MKTIEELLKNLARPEVLEFGLVTNRLPSVNIGGKFEPVDDEAPSNERLMQMLVTMGGGRHVDSLSDKPVQWTTRLDGVGVIAVAAILRKDVVQARFTVAKRDAQAGGARPSSPARPPDPPRPPERTAPSPQPPFAGGASPVPGRAQSLHPSSGPVALRQPPQVAQVPRAATLEGMPPVKPQGSQPAPRRREPEDDDEPTLQTASPPVSPPRTPNTARRPDESAATKAAAEEKAALLAKESERKRAEEESERAAQQKQADDAAKAARQEEESAAPPVPKAAPKPPAVGTMRRISTPTSIDAIDIGTSHDMRAGARPVPIDIDLESDLSTPAAPVAAAPAREKEPPRVDPQASIDVFLAMALAARASDLLIVAARPVLLRVATDLVPRTQAVTAEHVERIAKELIPARLREALERDGACDFAVEHPVHGRFRVNASRQRTGYKLNLRVIPRDVPTVASLGLPEAILAGVRHQRGIVLVSGPQASGKSATTAALIDHLNREVARHIVTIEEPVEHVHPRRRSLVSQREVGLHARTRARAVVAALREDADILSLGELRDVEAVRLALLAAESGRLVLATVAAPSAVKAIARVVELFAPNELLAARTAIAASLRMVVGQRLVPSVDRARVHAAVEIVPWSTALHAAIRDGRIEGIASGPRGKTGAVRLDESLAELVRGHKITLEAARQLAELPHEIEAPLARSSPPLAPRKA